jgi:hypothetical protein
MIEDEVKQKEIEFPNELDELDKFIIARRVADPCIKNRELAAISGYGEDTIGRHLKRPRVIETIKQLQRLVNLVNSEDDSVAIKACTAILKDVLENTGSAEERKSDIRSFLESLKDEDINAFEESRRNREDDN